MIEPLALYAALSAFWYVFIRFEWDSV